MDTQVARVEAKAREEARQKFEKEKRTIVKKMETEIMELQTHLRLFKKVNYSTVYILPTNSNLHNVRLC